MLIKYDNLLREIIFNSDTGKDLLDYGVFTENEIIDMLTGKKIITVLDAKRIKHLVRSGLPLEELFAEGE